jgi:hypothetical protein
MNPDALTDANIRGRNMNWRVSLRTSGFELTYSNPSEPFDAFGLANRDPCNFLSTTGQLHREQMAGCTHNL